MDRYSAQDLKALYGAYGNFYNLELGGISYPCRSILDIVHHDCTPLNVNHLLEQDPALCVIMMNPGRSRPQDHNYTPITIRDTEDILTRRELTLAVPDITQYQLMRVMAQTGINFVRVANLSDIRQPKSAIFIKTVEKLSNDSLNDHSMFSVARKREFGQLFSEDTPVLRAWGQDKKLLGLINNCIPYINGRTSYGVAVNDENTLYSHPSPMLEAKKAEWLEKIVPVIKAGFSKE